MHFFKLIKITENVKALWLDNLHLPVSTNGRVCSGHFEPTDIAVVNGRTWLKQEFGEPEFDPRMSQFQSPTNNQEFAQKIVGEDMGTDNEEKVWKIR